MSIGTIEATHNRITEKLKNTGLVYENLRSLCSIFDIQKINYKTKLTDKRLHINILTDEFEELVSKYNLSIVHVLSSYYTHQASNSREITSEYYRIITSDNYSSQIEEFLRKADDIRQILTRIYIEQTKPQGTKELTPKDKMYPLFEKIIQQIKYTATIKIKHDIITEDYENCECGGRFGPSPVSNELTCEHCGQMRILQGTATEEVQAQVTKVGRSKSGTYDPDRHFKFWIERIQAKEDKVFPTEDIEKIKYVIDRDKPSIPSVTEMRLILKECRLSKYNDHAPLLMKRFTRWIPPKFTHTQIKKFSAKFNRIMALLAKIRGTENNRPYYPHFIYKIIEDEIEYLLECGNISAARELESVFRFIHLQSDDTIRKHDELYRQICEISYQSDGLRFKITERKMYL